MNKKRDKQKKSTVANFGCAALPSCTAASHALAIWSQSLIVDTIPGPAAPPFWDSFELPALAAAGLTADHCGVGRGTLGERRRSSRLMVSGGRGVRSGSGCAATSATVVCHSNLCQPQQFDAWYASKDHAPPPTVPYQRLRSAL